MVDQSRSGLLHGGLLHRVGRTGQARPTPPAQAAEGRAGTRSDSVVNLALYRDGRRLAGPATLAEFFTSRREHPGCVSWVGLYRPSHDDVALLAREFGLHELAVEDAITAHQRPKLERYGDTLFVVLHAARYLDDVEEVEFGELHVFVGPDFVISMRHSESPDLTGVRARMESEPDLLALGPEAILYSIMDRVVDEYGPVVAGLENDIDEIETEIFSGDPAVSRRIYELSREVIDFRRATHPLNTMLQALQDGFDKYEVHEEMRRYLRDVADHNLQACDRVDGFSQILRDMLTVNATLVAQKQNEEMRALTEASHAQGIEVKRISAWAAILFAPTLIGTAYGMNFASMPGLDSPHGFTVAMALMLATCVALYVVFKQRDWL
jgi:magnesium transporter